MNEQQVTELCAAFALGAPMGPPKRITGGLLHRMWRLPTTRGDVAVKELNAEIMRRPGIRAIYRRSERIAAAMAARGIPAVTALDGANGTVQETTGATVMVYEWIDGDTLPPAAADPNRARQIGAILARIHMLDLPMFDLPAADWDTFTPDEWTLLAGRAQEIETSWGQSLRASLSDLREWSARYTEAAGRLGGTIVISHRDLDQKNVLWRDAETPLLIDWEATGSTNPALEIAGAALDWSGQTIGSPDAATFAAMMAGYRGAGGTLPNSGGDALWGVAGNWLGWLRYNIHRALGDAASDPDEQAIGVRETIATLTTLRAIAANHETWAHWLDSST